jgi:hypothetical protein
LLIGEIESKRPSIDAARGMIELLGWLGTPSGAETLTKLASRRFAFGGRRRAIRDAARAALAAAER